MMRSILVYAFLGLGLSVSIAETITIPTGPFCDGCEITNITYYSVEDVNQWQTNLQQSSSSLVDYLQTYKSSFGYHSGPTWDRTDIFYADLIIGSQEDTVPVGQAQRVARAFLAAAQEWEYMVSNTLEYAYVVDTYAHETVPEYVAEYAYLCEMSGSGSGSGHCCTNCCNCPDYTPYFIAITNRLMHIDILVSNINVDVNHMRRLFDQSLGFWLDQNNWDISWPFTDTVMAVLEGALVHTGYDLSVMSEWIGFADGGYWSYPVSSYLVSSNFLSSVHASDEEDYDGRTLEDWYYLLHHTDLRPQSPEEAPTVEKFAQLPILDRIALALFDLTYYTAPSNFPGFDSEVENTDPSDRIEHISYDTEDSSNASTQLDYIKRGLDNLTQSIAQSPDSTIRISSFTFPSIFGITPSEVGPWYVPLDEQGPLSYICPIVRRVFILAWSLVFAWFVYRVAIFYLVLFGRIVAVLWPLLHGDMTRASEAVHRVFDLTLFKAARFASFMGDFIETDSSQRSWYGQDL